MKSECRAVIDIGTNSVKLLVAEVTGRQVKPLCNRSEVTRLGQDSHGRGCLQSEAIARTAQVVAGFASIARAFRPDSFRVVATSAAREASNQAELINAIEQAAGLRTNVISGDQEAEWVFRGVSSDPKLAGTPLFIVDVGGGSSEVILGEQSSIYYRRSFAIGALRLFELLKPADPPSALDLAQCRAALNDFLHWEVAPELEPLLRAFRPRMPRLVGTGGSAAVLARIISAKAEKLADLDKSVFVKAKQVRIAVELLWSYSTEQRLKINGLPGKRADVILTGAAVFETFLTRFDFPQLTVSRRGLRHGVLLDSAGVGPSTITSSAQGVNPSQKNTTTEARFLSPTSRPPTVLRM
jgi:exopolyphosphatase/guanosine-5'-triphosphate,3'-diphosphate pyrophosphatase